MPRCIIFCGRPVDPPDLLGLTCQPGDLIIGADSGYLTARRLGFPPSLIIGDFDILGGTGGRLDHTIANLQTLAYLTTRGARGELRDRDCWARVIRDETITLPQGAYLKGPAYLSLFAMGGDCIVTETGVEYPLQDYPLSPSYPLGISNHITDTAVITARGTLLVMLCREG